MWATPFGHFLIEVFKLVAVVLAQAALFLPLACMIPAKKSQPLFRRDMITDLLYYFVSGLIITPANVWFLSFMQNTFHVTPLAVAFGADGTPLLSGWKMTAYFILAIFLVDFVQYWMHRFLHARAFWKIHSIHHCTKNVDWLSNNRSHPLNYILFICVAMDICFFLGFNPTLSPLVLVFYGITSCLIHANLNWTFGPLRYVFVSPVFHRWHHTYYDKGGNKNFAAIFSFLDLMFGTFYLPKNEMPVEFGTPDDPIPDSILGQLLYPFLKSKKPVKYGAATASEN